MRHGFVKTAAATPGIRLADCDYNALQIVTQINNAAKNGAKILVLPELCVTGYSCGDLFFQKNLLDAALGALKMIIDATVGIDMLTFVGFPLNVRGGLHNCAAVVCDGRLLGVVPKTHLPNYGEFNEARWFANAPDENQTITLFGSEVPFGTRLLFRCTSMPELCIAAEICEDIWTPLPPSIRHAIEGATVLVNLSASNEAASKSDYRRLMTQSLSTRLNCGYVYCSAGEGESTGSVVFSGHNIIAESGVIIAESELYTVGAIYSEVDVFRLDSERRRLNTFVPSADGRYRTVCFDLKHCDTTLTRHVARSPFVPEDAAERDRRCEEVLAIQTHGLKHRLQHVGAKTAIVNLSGGLDSTLALLVTARAIRAMGGNMKDIIALSLPCFGTSNRTRGNAAKLAAAMGVTFREIDITASVRQHFADIGHDGEPSGAAYENAQARERTQVGMDVANMEGGIMVGTGDLSELALGFTTYGGDQMSMYSVNGSVPKTMIAHMIRYEGGLSADATLSAVLDDICKTPISPELLPGIDGEIAQITEDIAGPYELTDFFLYYAIRWAFQPRKVLRLAQRAFEHSYDDATLLRWLRSFYHRFFANQFKRSCAPDGPKVGSVSLAPGGWHMPSDAMVKLWLDEIEE